MLTIDRRGLLLGVGSSALLASAASAVPESPGSRPASASIARPGVILNGFSPTDFPFRNLMSGASGIKAEGPFAAPSVMDDNGYPTATPATAISGSLPVPADYKGRYVLAWTGTGRFQLSFGGQPDQIVVHGGGKDVIGLGRTSGTVSYNLTVDGY